MYEKVRNFEMAAPGALSPSSDAAYPGRLLERQPPCLIRVRLDGVLLACNDAALVLFGVGARLAILNTNLTDRVVPDQRTSWQEFTTRCWTKGAASLECHLIVPDNDARPVLVEGIALNDHRDGVDSLLLILRDYGKGDEERQAIAERVKLAVQADEDQAERRRLTEALEAHVADRQRKEAKFVALERRVEQSQLLALQKEREYGRDTAMLKSALAAAVAAKSTGQEKQELEAVKLRLHAATAEQARLEAVIAEYEVDRQRIAADHQAAIHMLEQASARASEEATREFEQSRQALADVRSELAQALAEHTRMATRADEQAREQDLLHAEHRRALVDLEAGKDAALGELRSQLARMSAEHASLSARSELAERELELLRAERHQALANLEAGNRAAAELRQQLSLVCEERGRLATRVEEHELEHTRLIADHRASLEELRLQHAQALADQRRLIAQLEEHERERGNLVAEHYRALDDMETGKREALAELRSQLSQSFADQRRLASRADEQELELDRLRAEHHAALADAETRNRVALAELRSELEQAAAEPSRMLAARTEEHERERERLSGEHTLAIADLKASKEAALAELRCQLSEAVAEHHRLTALLEEHERERERIAAEHRRAIAELQASKQEAVAECERVLTEVQQALLVKDASRRLEVERRLIEGIDEAPQTKIDGERLASVQNGLTQAFSRMQAVFEDGAPVKPLAAEPEAIEPVDPLHEPFDDADDAFVNDLLQGIRALPEKRADPTAVPAKAVSATQTATTSDPAADDVFDDLDATFVRELMNTPAPARKPADQTDADPLQDL